MALEVNKPLMSMTVSSQHAESGCVYDKDSFSHDNFIDAFSEIFEAQIHTHDLFELGSKLHDALGDAAKDAVKEEIMLKAIEMAQSIVLDVSELDCEPVDCYTDEFCFSTGHYTNDWQEYSHGIEINIELDKGSSPDVLEVMPHFIEEIVDILKEDLGLNDEVELKVAHEVAPEIKPDIAPIMEHAASQQKASLSLTANERYNRL